MGCRREARTARHAGGNNEAIGVFGGCEDDAGAAPKWVVIRFTYREMLPWSMDGKGIV